MCPCLSNNSNSEYMVNIHQLAVQRLEAIANRMETAQYGNQGIIYPKSTSEGGYPPIIIIIVIIIINNIIIIIIII